MLSLTKHFTEPNRKTFRRLIQFHTGHAHIGEYYRRFIRTKDPTCSCSHVIQTRLHILWDCLRYINQQSLLGPRRYATLENLVGTKAGIKSLMKFITHMKAIDKHKPQRTNTHNPINQPNDTDRRGEGWERKPLPLSPPTTRPRTLTYNQHHTHWIDPLTTPQRTPPPDWHSLPL